MEKNAKDNVNGQQSNAILIFILIFLCVYLFIFLNAFVVR